MKKLNARILNPFRWIVAIMMLSFVLLWIAQSLIATRVLNQQMEQKINAIGANFGVMVADLNKTIRLLSEKKPTLWEAIKTGDTYALEDDLSWLAESYKLKGYIFVDNDGQVVASSFDNYIESELNEIINSKESTAYVGGCGSFVKDIICEYVCGPIIDDTDSTLGQVFLISFIATDMEAAMSLKVQHDVDIYIFSHDDCLLNTAGLDNAEVVPMAEVVDSCFESKTIWKGESEFAGEKYITTYMPLNDYKGEAKGMLCVSLPETLIEELVMAITLICIITLVIVLIVYFALSTRISNRLIKPVRELSDSVSVIAMGDLTKEIATSDYATEIHQLTVDIREMQNKIREMILPLAKASDALVGSMQQLSGASMQMSNAANRQAASLEEISSSMEEMGANIQQNTENSMHTNKIAENISSMVGEIGNAATDSYEAISNIAVDVQAINELVSQTNILALNASVEAARAGEQGKGFGVVAKEVGRLADQTHQTAYGINETATSSTAQAENAHRLVMELLPKIEQIATLIKEITAASIEQNAGVNQVNSAIMELNRVTQENAAGAQEVAASAQDIQRMLLEVKTALNIFKI